MADTVVADVGLSKQIDVDTELIIASLIALSCIMFTYSLCANVEYQSLMQEVANSEGECCVHIKIIRYTIA